MALTRDDVAALLEAEGLNYFVDPRPDKPRFMLPMRGMFGQYQIVVLLELDGTFLQWRTAGYLFCPMEHDHLLLVLQAIGHFNFVRRFAKIGWDASDGEIVVYGDMWVERDGTVTQQQFSRMMRNYLTCVDTAHDRLRRTMETGTDPGDLAFGDRGGAPPALPAALRELWERLRTDRPGEEAVDEDAIVV